MLTSVRGRAVSAAHRVVGTPGGQSVTAVVAAGLRSQREEHLPTDRDDHPASSPQVATSGWLGADVPVSVLDHDSCERAHRGGLYN